MASSFLGLYVQRDALLIAQKALDITGNNISNIDTAGYSRQRVDIVSVSNARNTLGYNTSIPLAGQGAEAVGVAQIRNRLLDRKVRMYSSDLCDVGVKTNVLGDIEDIFDSIEADSSDVESSFSAIVNKLKSALQSYATDNADRTEMANITKNSAESLVQAVRNYALKLDDISEQNLSDTKITVDRINAIFAEMGNLNKQIKDSYISMGYFTNDQSNYKVLNEYGPLELKDNMNSLLDELAQYGNIDFREESDGTFSVKFADQLVVSEKYYAQMAVTEYDPRPTELGFTVTKATMKNEWEPVTDERGKPVDGLYSKDEWYDLNVENNAGGDVQSMVREGLAGTTFDFSGKNANGKHYLDTGTLRGMLDMYNGRGIFAGEPNKYGAYVQEADEANKLLNELAAKIADGSLDSDEIDKYKSDLKDVIGARLVTDENGAITVKIGNTVVLDGTDPTAPVVKKLDVINPDAPKDLGNAAVTADGEIARTIALNDYRGIENYRDLLNSFVKTITDEFNGVYSQVPNPDFDPELPESDTNKRYMDPIKLFEFGDDFRHAAANFRVSQEWIDNPEIIANPSGQNEYEELDNTYIHKLLAFFTNNLTYDDGMGHTIKTERPFDKFVSYINEEVGTQKEAEDGVYEATDIVLAGVEDDRSAVMDVSMNEEGVNMMNYQKWYNAISRMISTIDEALDKLINNTGLVGLR